MIQDIGNHHLDRTYKQIDARNGDIALCYQKGSVLLKKTADGYALPHVGKDVDVSDGAQHLFTFDGTDCFRCTAPQKEATDCVYVPFGEIRDVRPMEVAYVAITGAQLNRWYSARQYCGRCGQRMKPSDIERAMVCPDCGLTEYPKICPAVIVAVKNGDKLLLTRYCDRPSRGYALIAGFVEIGETLEDTVRREVMEEVGLKVKNIRYYKNQPWALTDCQLVGFYCDVDGDTTIKVDHKELGEGIWLGRDEVPDRSGEISLTAEMIEQFRHGLE